MTGKTHGGKGSNRRKENIKLFGRNLAKTKFGVRDKSKDTFKVNIK